MMNTARQNTKYTHARPRGLTPWHPQTRTQELLEQVQNILREYSAHLPLTARQIFYRLVGAHDYAKNENSYSRLCDLLVRARRAEIVPFDWIRDDGATIRVPTGFDGLPCFWGAVKDTAETYRRNRLEGQTIVPEIWVEAAGMGPQIVRVAHEFGIPVFSSGGFDSLTVKHEAAQRILNRDRQTTVLHVGDHDPSGVSIFDAAAEDVSRLAVDLGAPLAPEFRRIAVTPGQIERYKLSESPPKSTDKRGNWKGGTVQVEALPPDILAGEVRTAIGTVIDEAALQRVIITEEHERQTLIEEVNNYLEVTP